MKGNALLAEVLKKKFYLSICRDLVDYLNSFDKKQ